MLYVCCGWDVDFGQMVYSCGLVGSSASGVLHHEACIINNGVTFCAQL